MRFKDNVNKITRHVFTIRCGLYKNKNKLYAVLVPYSKWSIKTIRPIENRVHAHENLNR